MAESVNPEIGPSLDALWYISALRMPAIIRPRHFKCESLERLNFPDQWPMDTVEYIRRMAVVESIEVNFTQNEEGVHYRQVALGASTTNEWYAPRFMISLARQADHVHACDVYATPPVPIETATPAKPADLIRIGNIQQALLAAEAQGARIHEYARYESVLAVRDMALATGAAMLDAIVSQPR